MKFSRSDGKDFTFLIKRDDLIHPFISGNKWRKLKGYLDQIKSMRDDTVLISCGGPYSNHILACAWAAKISGIRSIGLIRGTYHKTINELLYKAMDAGMEVRFISNLHYDKLQVDTHRVLEKLDLNVSSYFIPMGGKGQLGQFGCAEIMAELESDNIKFTNIHLAAGTGTTAAGILRAADQPFNMHVYPAIHRPQEVQYLQDFLSRVNPAIQVFIHTPHRCRFGKVDEKLIQFVRQFKDQTGILLDPNYNGKMVESVITEADSNTTGNGHLLYHSGGAYGWSGYDTSLSI